MAKISVGGAVGVIHISSLLLIVSLTTMLRPFVYGRSEHRSSPGRRPMQKQPVYKDTLLYMNGVSEAIFKVGLCLPAGSYITDDDVSFIVGAIKSAIDV